MLKRINYTDRRRIPRSQITVKVDPTDPASFTIDLPDNLLSNPDAEVAYIDITSAGSSEVLRHKLDWTGTGLRREGSRGRRGRPRAYPAASLTNQGRGGGQRPE